MYYGFNYKKLTQAIEMELSLVSIFTQTSDKGYISPYDGILFSTNKRPSAAFLNIVSGAIYPEYNSKKQMHYKYTLHHKYFFIQWSPFDINAPYTIIKINPSRLSLTPSQLLDIISYIIGDYKDVYVSSFDEKIDINGFTAKEVAERLYVGYKRKEPFDYDHKNETYYIGTRAGQQVKIYDKAKQMGVKGLLVRIEKKVKYPKGQRPVVTNFLLDKRDDLFKHMVMVNIDNIDGRNKVRRALRQMGILMSVYQSLKKYEKEKLRRHESFKYPLMDIQANLQSELAKWLATSSIALKVFVDKAQSIISKYYSTTAKYTRQINPISPPLAISNSLSSFNSKGKYNTTIQCDLIAEI
jgi:hypothetical protein